jgi:hypothetical protein
LKPPSTFHLGDLKMKTLLFALAGTLAAACASAQTK